MSARQLLVIWLLAGAGLSARQSSQAWPPAIPTVPQGEVRAVPVRGNVYMIVGAGANITVHAGDEGILMVDTGLAAMNEKVWAAVRSISPRPLRYIVNTNERLEHTGANEQLAAKGSTIPFRPASDTRVSDGRLGKDRANVISYLSVFDRMSAPTGQAASRPEEAWPDNTFSSPQKKLYFNHEPVIITHVPSTTDGDSIVQFRLADVISTGDLVDLTSYPIIDRKAGGSIEAVVQGVTKVIDLTVTDRKSEAGTLVIPGHGRLADQPDLVYYQQMLLIIRDRVRDMIGRGMTVEQVKAARPTRDYDPRFGRATGPWTTDMFVTAVYEGLKQ